MQSLLSDFNPWWANARAGWRRGYPRRDLLTELERRLQFPTQSARALLILGPRRVGKTVLLEQLADSLIASGMPAGNVLRFDFRDDRVDHTLAPDDLLGESTPGMDPNLPRVLLLDEISSMGRLRAAPEWDRWLLRVVNEQFRLERPQVRIVATDSAANLLTGARELLHGRVDLLHLRGLSFREYLRVRSWTSGTPTDPPLGLLETAAAVELPAFLRTGGFPEHAQAKSDSELSAARERIRLDTMSLAIARDVRDFAEEVRQPAKIERLFHYYVERSGALHSVEQRCKDLEINSRTLDVWMNLLYRTALLEPMAPVSAAAMRLPKATARLRARSKVYAFDHGLVSAFAPSPDPMALPEVRGTLLETLVASELRRGMRADDRLEFFRLDDQFEIDFVLTRKGSRVAVEVHAGDIDNEKIRSAREAGERADARRTIVVHGGAAESTRLEVRLVPLARFLLDPERYLEGGS
jgi:predicted AAA+ superfamily ATPase